MAAAVLVARRPEWEIRSAGVEAVDKGMELAVLEVISDGGYCLDSETRRVRLSQDLLAWADIAIMIVEPARWPAWVSDYDVLYWDIRDPAGGIEELITALGQIETGVDELLVTIEAGGQA
jgi:protein-tyrosine-phosphatase